MVFLYHVSVPDPDLSYVHIVNIETSEHTLCLQYQVMTECKTDTLVLQMGCP